MCAFYHLDPKSITKNSVSFLYTIFQIILGILKTTKKKLENKIKRTKKNLKILFKYIKIQIFE